MRNLKPSTKELTCSRIKVLGVDMEYKMGWIIFITSVTAMASFFLMVLLG